ncbi:hypothetical protein O181_019379 [Austropuccinia psidii MF-1]|uniref:C2H2-type domain-containing protein n=1 Tax=Austropuccinia psidii MF-1 TaxID=1389203 RepID=A0A9Q3GUN8_9BASI|nr:hypothetical protein [Austropuccinia psidii MF-1]
MSDFQIFTSEPLPKSENNDQWEESRKTYSQSLNSTIHSKSSDISQEPTVDDALGPSSSPSDCRNQVVMPTASKVYQGSHKEANEEIEVFKHVPSLVTWENMSKNDDLSEVGPLRNFEAKTTQKKNRKQKPYEEGNGNPKHDPAGYTCPICQTGKVIKRRSNFVRHMETHLPKEDRERFQCGLPGCSASYLYKHDVAKHQRNFHKIGLVKKEREEPLAQE